MMRTIVILAVAMAMVHQATTVTQAHALTVAIMCDGATSVSPDIEHHLNEARSELADRTAAATQLVDDVAKLLPRLGLALHDLTIGLARHLVETNLEPFLQQIHLLAERARGTRRVHGHLLERTLEVLDRLRCRIERFGRILSTLNQEVEPSR